jgi:hypothetical protein
MEGGVTAALKSLLSFDEAGGTATGSRPAAAEMTNVR